MLTPELDMFITRMPKVELHIHLEGSVAPRTVLDLARRNHIEIPANSVKGIERMFQYHDLREFLSVFMELTRTIVYPGDFEQLAYEMGVMLSAQHVFYAEVMLSPMQHLLRGINLMQAIISTAKGFAQAQRETGIVVRLALDYGRQYGTHYAWYVLEIAKEAMEHGVVAWSIGGDEINHPPEPFAEVFAAAREAGLHVMAHAGEVAGPESVWGAVKELQVERIGHGIQSIKDMKLVEYLCDQHIVLDVCPSSNVCTGASPSWQQHALRQLYEAGVIVTINSDDPPFFQTTLTDEYRRVAHYFGFTANDLCILVRNSVKASFLPETEKLSLLKRVDQELATLRVELGV